MFILFSIFVGYFKTVFCSPYDFTVENILVSFFNFKFVPYRKFLHSSSISHFYNERQDTDDFCEGCIMGKKLPFSASDDDQIDFNNLLVT